MEKIFYCIVNGKNQVITTHLDGCVFLERHNPGAIHSKRVGPFDEDGLFFEQTKISGMKLKYCKFCMPDKYLGLLQTINSNPQFIMTVPNNGIVNTRIIPFVA